MLIFKFHEGVTFVRAFMRSGLLGTHAVGEDVFAL
jgi:hypothetical protein